MLLLGCHPAMLMGQRVTRLLHLHLKNLKAEKKMLRIRLQEITIHC
uniref:Uncharacterized protein n=1 Tax=Rhizophora mucronata TaxID=61149 RepID=A0A2P2PQS0_RHIMU